LTGYFFVATLSLAFGYGLVFFPRLLQGAFLHITMGICALVFLLFVTIRGFDKIQSATERRQED
jgi:hypothetical protein